jgi:hypothetical protein
MKSKTSDLDRFQRDSGFWTEPEMWPHDTPEYVFLARACLMFGEAMFGKDWVDDSWSIKEPEEPPDDCDHETWERYERECNEGEAAFKRMRDEVIQAITKSCQTRKLDTALRWKPGGELLKQDHNVWNTEDYMRRFSRCDLSLHAPFTIGAKRDWWIYVSRISLDKQLAELRRSTSTHNDRDKVVDRCLSGAASSLPHGIVAIIEVMKQLWPSSGGLPLPGVAAKERDKKVTDELLNQGKKRVSQSSIQRALKIIKATR